METIFVTPDDNEIITENYQNVSNFLSIPILIINMKSALIFLLALNTLKLDIATQKLIDRLSQLIIGLKMKIWRLMIIGLKVKI